MSNKPLGGKVYFSIPHLPGSYLGNHDRFAEPNQIELITNNKNTKTDKVIYTEKYDGSNVAVANIDGKITALIRAGYLAGTSPHAQHNVFDYWVKKNEHRFKKFLHRGERICGEWLLLSHGIRYELSCDPFVIFDYMYSDGKSSNNIYPFVETQRIAKKLNLESARVLQWGGSLGNDELIQRLSNQKDSKIKCKSPEGYVARLERGEKFLFQAKYVRPNFKPGIYLENISGNDAVFNSLQKKDSDLVGEYKKFLIEINRESNG